MTGLEYYESYIVSISTDSVDTDNINVKRDTINSITDTVFLKVLATGTYASLYSYTDKTKVRFYLSAPGITSPEELAYHAYYSEDRDNSVHFNTRYRTQLIYAAQKSNTDNTTLESLILKATYSEHDILPIVLNINGSSGTTIVSKSLVGSRWFAGAGIAYNDMLFSGFIEYPDDYTIFPRAAAGIDFFVNKNTQQLFVRLELTLTGDQHTFNNSYEQSQLKVTQYTASFVPQVYYNFYNGRKLKIFAGGGIAVNVSTYPTHYWISPQGIDLVPVKKDNFPDYHKLWESFLLKAGVMFSRKIEIYAGYSPATTLTDNYNFFAGNVVSYQFGINYLFGVK